MVAGFPWGLTEQLNIEQEPMKTQTWDSLTNQPEQLGLPPWLEEQRVPGEAAADIEVAAHLGGMVNFRVSVLSQAAHQPPHHSQGARLAIEESEVKSPSILDKTGTEDGSSSLNNHLFSSLDTYVKYKLHVFFYAKSLSGKSTGARSIQPYNAAMPQPLTTFTHTLTQPTSIKSLASCPDPHPVISIAI